MTPILPGAPWLIAHRSMLGVNKPYKVTLNCQDYVLWQNSQGDVFALENICPHMQAPLSNGWICQSGRAIACPFHALEFDGKGSHIKDGKPSARMNVKQLELIVQGDLIWTYGGYSPRLPIPDLIERKTQGLPFMGVAGETSIKSNFLSCIKINYDFNHQNGSHRESFRITDNPVELFESNEYYAKVVQTFIRENNTFAEIMQNPALLNTPKVYRSELEYTFPSTTLFNAEVSFGNIPQFFVLYPETENRTKTFVLCYGKWTNSLFNLPGLKQFAKKSLLKAIAKVVEQDAATLESLYPPEHPKIRLPKEEIMHYVEKLYRNWEKTNN